MRDPSEIWTGFASSYDRARPTPPSALLDLLMQLIGMPHPALVVDLGSGTGLSTSIWGERAEQVIGIEPNADMRTQAVRKVEGYPYATHITYREGVAHTHLDRMRDTGHFRFTRELFLHHIEQGDAARFLEMILTNAYSHQFSLKTITEQEIGFDRLRSAAFQSLGSEPIPWYFSYRVCIGIK